MLLHLFKGQLIEHCLSIAVLSLALAIPAAGGVIVVDNSRPQQGDGTFDRPFTTLAAAQTRAGSGDIVYVAEGSGPYEEGLTLKKGQMLIGSAFGLDAVRTEFHAQFEAPPTPAARGTGPIIHGTIVLAGDNVVAGCTLIADQKVPVAVSAQSPQGPIALRSLFLKTSSNAYALYISDNTFPLTWTSGRIDSAQRGAGIVISSGSGNITFDHVAVTGEFARAIEVRGRSGGTVLFHNASPVSIGDASSDGVVIAGARGTIRFESPLQITTNGGRGMVVNNAQKVDVAGGNSWIETTNATALDVRDSAVDIVFDHVSAQGISPGRLLEGVIADKVRGRFEIAGGTITSALSYGLRLTQSSDIRVHNLKIVGGGTVNAKEECPQDIPAQTNLRCRAGIYLRHIERSRFEAISITGNEGVGLNANNLTDDTFADLQINRTGSSANEPSVLIDEARGTLSFRRCAFLDGAGGAVVIQQRFNTARILCDLCELGAPQRPSSAELFRATVSGQARLDLQLPNLRAYANARGAIAIEAKERGALVLTLGDGYFSQINSTPVAVNLAGASSVCFDPGTNVFAGIAPPFIRLSAHEQAQLKIVGTADAIAKRNGGNPMVTDGAAISVTESCR